ncbi:MAG: hypothetical protein NZU63_02335 [Gemmataceae bacterium]|nr:hypothetical protein [Gemmataceae bacterium]MDW8243333.1 hypothetical protein [Thermogemmata sp.]
MTMLLLAATAGSGRLGGLGRSSTCGKVAELSWNSVQRGRCPSCDTRSELLIGVITN